MQEDQFWLLVSLKLSGEATQEELAALHMYLQQHPEMGLRLDILHTLWNQPSTGVSGLGEDALRRHHERLRHHSPEREPDSLPAPSDPEEVSPPRYRRRWLWPVTGVAASLLTFLLFFYQLPSPKKTHRLLAQNTVSTRLGSKSKIQLPDGSQVWLNADSRIIYNESFGDSSREIQLTGEAYFDVIKDKNHPFIIHTSSIDVRVLGTALNIRSYANEKNTEAVLIRGSIEVILRNHPDKKIILQPNEKIVVQNGNCIVLPGAFPAGATGALHTVQNDDQPVMTLSKAHFREKDSVATEVQWVKNKLAFDKEPLTEVALKIERWYAVKVLITKERLRHTEYSGVFEDESLRQVMEALRLTGSFHYSIDKKEVIISP